MILFQKLFQKSPWKVASVRLGTTTFKIPYAEIEGNRPGKTLLVTGGIDGDEYAGMEAVYAIHEKYISGDFAGRLRLLPVVNMPGFQAECSQNPLDQKFPKYFFTGNSNGSPTEQLISWLYREHIQGVDVWYDAHGGAITEGLNPFLWVYDTGNKEVNLFSQNLVKGCDADLVISEWAGIMSKAGKLAHGGCHYVLGESGSLGARNRKDILRHVGWIESLMKVHGMLDGVVSSKNKPQIYKHVAFVYAPYEGIWRPEVSIGLEQKKGQKIGQSMKKDGSSVQIVHASHTGVPLWWKETMAMRKGDILLAIGW